MKLLNLLAALCLAGLACGAAAQTADPYLWLEDVQGDKPLAWVRERNAQTEARLQAQPGFDTLRSQVRAVLDNTDQIPYVQRMGPWLYNLWRDKTQPRGLWRRTTLAEYKKAQPAWETVIDLDALAKAEGENWVWGGADCLAPAYARCMVGLSRGGADARVMREFDTGSKRFVEGGFTVPEAKTRTEWLDADRLYVAGDFGPGSLTTSGYPRTVKRWQRGTPLAAATLVFEGRAADVSVWVTVDRNPGHERTVFSRSVDFFKRQDFLLQGEQLQPIPKPDDLQFTFWRNQVLALLRSPWVLEGRTWPSGSLLVGEAQAFLNGTPKFEALFTPSPTRALAAYTTTASAVLLTVSDNVANRLEEWKLGEGGWARRAVEAPFPGTLSASSLHDKLQKDDPLGDHYLLNVSDFLRPDTLQLGRVGSDSRELLKSRPSFYDATGQRVEQLFATSKDGTRVPYFVVWPKDAKADGDNPTLLYGYGGFQVSMRPGYSATQGLGWTTRGGVYVLANIRGGGEFGPAWHQAALKANKQKSYDDFIAVAEDLVARKITRPARLGIQGGSNGGLLVGAVMLQRPDLFNAVVCQVPLLDMQRYHLLLAGASWMAEYGNPDKPEEWAWMAGYSPYQNVKPGTKYPPVFFTTSTRDDRVHPGHARKMAARMLEAGQPVLYWENIEGGHAGAADSSQRAQKTALEFAFLWQQLGRR